MHHLAIKAVAAALMVGAGTGAVTKIDSSSKGGIPRDVLNPMIGGQAMLTKASILDNISKSPDNTTFLAAAKASQLTEALKGSHTITVFAPSNAAYTALPRDASVEARNEARYLVVPGRYDSQKLLGLINAKGGEVKLKTLEGGTLTAMLNGPTNIALVDEQGHVADISIYDVYQRNGVVQVIDHVLMPKAPRANS
ncbi:MAG TPA: fasciclin domain-containing protein [Rhizomicrobium sp.]|jgi:uncharacterized surface protein with fasciclin (FAS1) repeats|nr:fasciclin domain-containing protein [Rhizomicrobium sp.]